MQGSSNELVAIRWRGCLYHIKICLPLKNENATLRVFSKVSEDSRLVLRKMTGEIPEQMP